MSLSRQLIICLLSFIGGIFIADFFDVSLIIFASAIVILSLFLIFFRKEKVLLICALAILTAVSGIFYSNIYKNLSSGRNIERFMGQKVVLEGFISQPVDVKVDKSNITFDVEKVSLKNRSQKIETKVLIYAPKYPKRAFGDYLKVSGILREPPIFPDFNYKKYLERYQIKAVIFAEEIQVLKKEPRQNIWQKSFFIVEKELFSLVEIFEAKVNELLPEPQGALLQGLLLGVKKFMPQNLIDNFSQTGTTHIIVISGFNITIIIKVFMALTKRWSRKLAYISAILGIIAFIIMTGASSSIVRAGIMAGILMWAEREGRRSDATIALLVAAMIMILINPLILRFDVGFQLSFLATAGLIYFSPILETWLKESHLKKVPKIMSPTRGKNPIVNVVTEAGVATISAQIFVLPILLINFGRLSIIAPLANILILPVVPLTMLIGFISVIAGFIFLPVGQFFSAFAWFLLSYIIFIVQKLANIPGAFFEVGKFSWVWLVVYYLALAAFVIYFNIRQKTIIQKVEEDETG